ncbi:hypothetical protein RRG08_033875 [Elysia crispata]|uniref:Uncharacterized protein n=1 Tax=Elysia crispata TaxID=231223 RepID=A0AAE1EBN7_9GAST|nr:hypothetical protein RRG08_033875 [Elysia crispata]
MDPFLPLTPWAALYTEWHKFKHFRWSDWTLEGWTVLPKTGQWSSLWVSSIENMSMAGHFFRSGSGESPFLFIAILPKISAAFNNPTILEWYAARQFLSEVPVSMWRKGARSHGPLKAYPGRLQKRPTAGEIRAASQCSLQYIASSGKAASPRDKQADIRIQPWVDLDTEITSHRFARSQSQRARCGIRSPQDSQLSRSHHTVLTTTSCSRYCLNNGVEN